MRRFFAFVLGVGVPISIGYAVACGPPESFENLTGGQKTPDGGGDGPSPPLVEDPSLPAPRPTAPLAGSWLNGSRPRFRWDLGSASLVGARVVVCADPACTDASKTKTWTASGPELTAPEDLSPGRYFWHLVGTSASAFGTKASPVWTMRVRGGAGAGTAAGAFCDPNGDGISDLFLPVEYKDLAAPGQPTYYDAVLVLGGSLEDPLALVTALPDEARLPRNFQVGLSSGLSIQVVDIDGDGIGDPIFSDIVGPSAPGKAGVFAVKGASKLAAPVDLGRPTLPGLDAIPQLAAPGDFDGDGRGDLFVGTKQAPLVVFGASDGLGAFMFLSTLPLVPNPDAGELPNPTSPMAIGGADLDDDGRVDVAIPSFWRDEGLFFVQTKGGDRQTFFMSIGLPIDAGVSGPATAFAFGDVDGDGRSDIGFASALEGKPVICILTRGADGEGGPRACWAPPTAPGSSIVMADLEGDGKDEVLVGSGGGGVDVLRLPSPETIEVEHLTTDYGVTMTVLDPGRPGAAVWAATRADGSSVALFQGKEQKRIIRLEELSVGPSYPAIRIHPGIR